MAYYCAADSDKRNVFSRLRPQVSSHRFVAIRVVITRTKSGTILSPKRNSMTAYFYLSVRYRHSMTATERAIGSRSSCTNTVSCVRTVTTCVTYGDHMGVYILLVGAIKSEPIDMLRKRAHKAPRAPGVF